MLQWTYIRSHSGQIHLLVISFFLCQCKHRNGVMVTAFILAHSKKNTRLYCCIIIVSHIQKNIHFFRRGWSRESPKVHLASSSLHLLPPMVAPAALALPASAASLASIWSSMDLSLSGNPLRSHNKVGKGLPPSVTHVNLTWSPDLCSLSKSPWIWGGEGGSEKPICVGYYICTYVWFYRGSI